MAYFAIATFAFGETPQVKDSTQIWGSYLANRVSKQITDTPTLWSSLSLQWESGFYLSWLEIHDLKDTDWSSSPGQGGYDETNISVGYKWKVFGLDAKIESTLINVHPIENWFDNDLCAIDLYLSKTYNFDWHGKHALTPELRFVWIGDSQHFTSGVPGYMPTVYHNWKAPFGLEVLSLQTRIAISADGGLKKSTPGVFLQAETGFGWKIGSATLTLPGIKCFAPLSNQSDGRGSAMSLFVGISHPW
jgi:hypothetical protein